MKLRALTPRVSARRVFAGVVLAGMLFSLVSPWQRTVSSQLRGARAERKGTPIPGKPEGQVKRVDQVRQEVEVNHEQLEREPSTVRSPKLPLKAWDGRRVGDPLPGAEPPEKDGEVRREKSGRAKQAGERQVVRRAHAKGRAPSAPFVVVDDNFIDNFYMFVMTVSYTPQMTEKPYWRDQLRVGYAKNQTALKLAAQEMGRTLFESAWYLGRNRSNSDYVYDLYWTYLMRAPDASGWNFWTGVVASNGREYVRRSFEESGEFVTLVSTMVPNGSASGTPSSLLSAQTDPRNQPGGGLLTRDGTWSMPLISLPGRAGLDLGLTLSYSSQVWTKSGPYLYFDEDSGNPSPGFRLGFPTIQRRALNSQTNTLSYLVVTSSGRRVELRQVGTTNVYEAADSTYLQLTDNGSTLLLRSTDGTQLTYQEASNEWRCNQVKDRNGNYLTVALGSLGQLTSVTDTLGRVINFNYDGNMNLQSITQTWGGPVTHTWAFFSWATKTMQSSFSSSVPVIGTRNGTVFPVLDTVYGNDGTYFKFTYNDSLQVTTIKKYHELDIPAVLRSTNTFTYETPGTDVPRVTDTRVSAINWTGINGVPAEVVTQFSVAGDGACVMTTPDGTLYKEYYGTGYQKGLKLSSEVWSGGVKQKWTTTAWTQDDTNKPYEVNPRVTETNTYDASGNRRRVAIEYHTQFGLPQYIIEYAGDGVTWTRRTHLAYALDTQYLERRIIGLLFQKEVFDGSWAPLERTQYNYDEGGDYMAGLPNAPTQHDGTNYSASFIWARGNITAVKRYDVTDYYNESKVLYSRTGYNLTGSVRFTRDGLNHQTTIGYGDSFSDNNNGRNTYAYTTSMTDPDGNVSYKQHNFDHGATTRNEGPPPPNQSQGLIRTMLYNSRGQLERVTTSGNNAYQRFLYSSEYIATYSAVNTLNDDLYSAQYFDGVGRPIRTAGNHPNSTGGYKALVTIYDQMGRVIKQSNPTEIFSNWVPAGDDAAGYLYTQQTYNWQGKALVTTNADNTSSEVSYSGCGCAGGEVVTITDEGTIEGVVTKRRQRKIYSDVFGRTVKSETLNWQGGSVYAATENTYNMRDQVTQMRQFAGGVGSGTYQDTVFTYDGYGRVKTKHNPEHSPNTFTSWSYNADDTVNVITDPRGATSTFTYNNNRGLVNTAVYALSGSPTLTLSYTYDAAGNRTSMTDPSGSVTYTYNALSQLTAETRQFTGISNQSFTMGYDYNLMGQLKTFTLPAAYGTTVNYQYDNAARLLALTNSGYSYSDPNSIQTRVEIPMNTFLTGITYRAWNDVEHMETGLGVHSNYQYDAQMRPSSYAVSNLTNGTMTWNYDYHPDGNIRLASDVADNRFDRKYEYDHVGRLVEAYSGIEARGGTAIDGSESPYRLSFLFDAFGNQRQQSGRIWQKPLSAELYTYTNNRRSGLTYDAAGNVITDPQGNHTFNAQGLRSLVTAGEVGGGSSGNPVQPAQETATVYDGNGLPASVTNTTRSETLLGQGPQTLISTDSTSTFYLRSTVLNAVISEMNNQGQRSAEYIYAGGERIAQWSISPWNDGIEWQYGNPVTESWITFWAPFNTAYRTEVDPTGRATGDQPFFIPPDPPEPQPSREPTYYLIEGGPTIEAELGMQLYEDQYVNPIFGPAAGPLQGNYKSQAWQDWQRWREFQLMTGLRFLFGIDKMNANIAGYDREEVKYSIVVTRGFEDQTRYKFVRGHYNLKPGSSARQRRTQGGSPKTDTVADNPAVDVSRVNELLQNPICERFLNALLGKLDEIHTAEQTSSSDFFRSYFNSLNDNGAFHNAQLADENGVEVLGRAVSQEMLLIDVSKASPQGGRWAVEYTAIHEGVHRVNHVETSHFEMATAAYQVGRAQGLFKGMKNIQPVVSNSASQRQQDEADHRNSERFDKMLYAACPPGKK